jgi:hypothetical protein
MGMSLALDASGNLIPTGDLDRLVKKDGPQKLGRSGNLRRFGRLTAKALTSLSVMTIASSTLPGVTLVAIALQAW